MEEKPPLSVVISYGELKAEFSGSPEAVLNSVNSFLAKQIPALDLASKILLNYSVADLIRDFEKLIRVTPEGPRILLEGIKLSDKEVIALALVAAKVGQGTGRRELDGLTLMELQEWTNLKPKSISSRLSELVKSGHASREEVDKNPLYKITTMGINWLKGILAKKKVLE